MKHTVLAILSIFLPFTFAYAVCPNLQARETQSDCPWAEITRLTNGLHATSYHKKIRNMINEQAPEFLSQIKHDKKIGNLLDLWGVSRNSDESHPNEPIVPHNILSVLAKELEHTPFDQSFKFGNAGLNHTYGYLFSNLQTPYGYKRARYVDAEIEKGFGLTPGLFSGAPKEGSLLSNFTFFIGSIALGEAPYAKELAIKELANFSYGKLKFTRLVELAKAEHSMLVMRTDIVPFTHPSTDANSNTALLIYSIDEGQGPKLITSFPVQKKFGESLFKPETLGDQTTIKIKYNGWLKKNTPATSYTGSRKKVEMP